MRFADCWRKTMAKRKPRKLTPEDEARFEENLRRLRARVAEREARELERRRAAAG